MGGGSKEHCTVIIYFRANRVMPLIVSKHAVREEAESFVPHPLLQKTR